MLIIQENQQSEKELAEPQWTKASGRQMLYIFLAHESRATKEDMVKSFLKAKTNMHKDRSNYTFIHMSSSSR